MKKSSKGMDAASYKSVGTTRDGVKILKPKMKPSHFTTKEIRSAIKQVLSEQSPAGLTEDTQPARRATKI